MPDYKVNQQDTGVRVDSFVAGRLEKYPRSALKALFTTEQVRINNYPVKPGEKLKGGQTVSVDDSTLRAQPAKIDLPVIYEDKDVVVINKPAGVLTHSKGAVNLEPSVASFLSRKIVDKSLTGNRAGIVHRLDRATSGLIIGARSSAALKFLQKQFSTRKVRKTYLAIVEGVPSPKEAIIDIPIGRNPKKPQTFHPVLSGKPAQTQFRVLRQFNKAGRQFSRIELRPVTGRTHQLRVHLAYIGHPVVGDALYGRGGKELLLHAAQLELQLPNGAHKAFSAPTPKSFVTFQKEK